MSGEGGRSRWTWRWLPALLLAAALVAGLVFWLSQSSLLAIEEIEVEGTIVVPDEEVVAATAPYLLGRSLVSLSYDEAAAALADRPFIESVSFDRRPPHTICIRVRERRPVLVFNDVSGRYFIVSDEGFVIASRQGPDPDLPLLTVAGACAVEAGAPTDCGELLTGVAFVADIPAEFNHRFTEVSVAGEDIRAVTAGGTRVVFGSLEQYQLKFEVLRQLLARTAQPGVKTTIDVSVPERPVTRQGEPEPATKGEAHATTTAAGAAGTVE